MVYQKFRLMYMEMPWLTKAYITACVITTFAVEMGVVSPLQLHSNPLLKAKELKLWRSITSFFFIGRMGFDFVFSMLLSYQCCRMLEEGSFRGRTVDLVMMFCCGVFGIVFCSLFKNLMFFGRACTMMLLYAWSCRTPLVIAQYGFISFKLQAKYLPWMLLASSMLSGNEIPMNLVGMAVGHVYYLLEDVIPKWSEVLRFLQLSPDVYAAFDPEPQQPEHQPRRKRKKQ